MRSVLTGIGEDTRRIIGDGPSAEHRAAQREAIAEAAEAEPASRFLPRVWIAAAAAACLVLALGLTILLSGSGIRCFAQGRNEVRAGDFLSALDARPLVLDFSESSRVEIRGGGRARLVKMDRSEVRMALESGTLGIHVASAGGAIWSFGCGPYTIRVIGTRLTASWKADEQRLAVEVSQGVVAVEGGHLGQSGLLVRADKRLVVTAEESHLLPAQAAEQTERAHREGEPQTGSLVEGKGKGDLPDEGKPTGDRGSRVEVALTGWRTLAEKGRYAEALAAAEQEGLEHLFESAKEEELLLLSDAARLADDPDRAVRALEAIRRRFAGRPAAAQAAYRLGRIASTRGSLRQAAVWYGRYAEELPRGTLAAEAAGRQMEALHKAGARSEAEKAAAEYLVLYPGGLYADLARSLVGRQ